MGSLTTDQIKKINKKALAEKHNCSDAHVGKVLRGEITQNRDKAKQIYRDAQSIIEVLEGKEPQQTGNN